MANLSTYSINAVLDAFFRNIGFTSPTTVYLALYLTDPTPNDIGTEVSGGSYTRMPVTFTAPSGGAIQNTVDITFPTATANWGTVAFAGIRDALSGGNLLAFGPLSIPKTVSIADILKFTAGNVFVTAS